MCISSKKESQNNIRKICSQRLFVQSTILVKSLGFAHGGLDVEALDVLPVLLEQGHKEVHGQADVLHQLIIRHLDVAHGDVQAENLLHLELDGGLEDIHLLPH